MCLIFRYGGRYVFMGSDQKEDIIYTMVKSAYLNFVFHKFDGSLIPVYSNKNYNYLISSSHLSLGDPHMSSQKVVKLRGLRASPM